VTSLSLWLDNWVPRINTRSKLLLLFPAILSSGLVGLVVE
jgi:hypothetical protein